MPNIETADLHQKAVLYEEDGYDDYGDAKTKTAVEIDVRWETGQREALDAEGNTIAIDSIAVVDRVIPVDSAMWLGKLADLPSPVTDLRTVVAYDETPDIKNRHIRRVVSLMKLSDEVPASA